MPIEFTLCQQLRYVVLDQVKQVWGKRRILPVSFSRLLCLDLCSSSSSLILKLFAIFGELLRGLVLMCSLELERYHVCRLLSLQQC